MKGHSGWPKNILSNYEKLPNRSSMKIEGLDASILSLKKNWYELQESFTRKPEEQ